MKIRTKILIPSIAGIIILSVVSLVLFSSNMTSQINENLKISHMDKINSIYNNVERTATVALEQAALFSQSPSVIKAYKMAVEEGNINDPKDSIVQDAREQLREAMASYNKGYQDMLGIKSLRIHFHLSNIRSFLRLWRNKQAKVDGKWMDISDNLRGFRNTVIEVNKSGKAVKGLELGRGGFTIRGLAPIKDENGKHLGSDEVLIDYFTLIKHFQTDENQHAVLYMDGKFRSITTRMHNEEKNPVTQYQGGSFVFVNSTNTEFTNKVIQPEYLVAGLKGISHFHLKDHYVTAAPVKDFNDKPIGVLALVSDISKQKAAIAGARLSYGIGAMFLLAFLSSLLFLVVR